MGRFPTLSIGGNVAPHRGTDSRPYIPDTGGTGEERMDLFLDVKG